MYDFIIIITFLAIIIQALFLTNIFYRLHTIQECMMNSSAH